MLLLLYLDLLLLLASQPAVTALLASAADPRLNKAQPICVSEFGDNVVEARRGELINASNSSLANLVGSQLLANRTCLCTSPNQVPNGYLTAIQAH